MVWRVLKVALRRARQGTFIFPLKLYVILTRYMARVGHNRILYHVLFAETYRMVDIINSGDLSVVDSFRLLEGEI